MSAHLAIDGVLFVTELWLGATSPGPSSKVKKIRLVDPDANAGHNIDAKAAGMAVLLRSRFVKKA